MSPKETISFKDFFAELYEADHHKKLLLEYECYRLIPGTKNSYREDPYRSSTGVPEHSHVYARPKGNGRELYVVTRDGKGSHGASGREIPAAHADYFRSRGYQIPPSNILECISAVGLQASRFQLLFD
jgi:hypothetical protein